MKLPQKLQVILAMTYLQEQWPTVSFSHYGSFILCRRCAVTSRRPQHQGWQGCSDMAGCQLINFEYRERAMYIKVHPIFAQLLAFVGASLTQYLQAIGTREMKAIQSLKLPKQIALLYGPKLY